MKRNPSESFLCPTMQSLYIRDKNTKNPKQNVALEMIKDQT